MHFPSKSFAHLHVHTHYSLLKSSCSISGLVQKCVDYSQPAIAITDYGNMFGVFDLYFKAKEKAIKPILGLEIYLSSEPYLNKKNYFISGYSHSAFHTRDPSIVLLAQNLEGYRNLCRINTLAYRNGFYYVPRVDYQVLKEHSGSLLALSGGVSGEVPQVFLKKGPDKALSVIKKLKSIYQDRFYLQLNRTHLEEWDRINSFLMEASKISQVALVAGNDVHYLNRADHVVQDVLFCIGVNRTLRDRERFRLKTDQFYFKSSNEMRELFKDIPKACDNTLEIVSRCELEFTLKKAGQPIYHLPTLKGELKDQTAKQKLRDLTFKGLNKRIHELKQKTELYQGSKNQGSKNQDSKSLTDEDSSKMKTLNGLALDPKNLQEKSFSNENQKQPNVKFKSKKHHIDTNKYEHRLEEELKIITDMGFADYFLIVYDFVHWAKKQNIPVGPGRGSGASSLVAYCLEITDLDPMPYSLLFERFLNPERISLPDFDIDFCQEHRNRVIEYVSNKYGKDYVAQVMTYGRLQARAAIRDVGRVLGMSYMEVNQVVKLIPDRLGITLGEALQENQELVELMEADSQVDNLISLARQIEGLIRHVSIHAAGVIISDHPIISFAPLYPGAEGENVIQCDLNHSKKIGLVKFDFLGLKTLTQINLAFKMISKHQKKHVSYQDISLEDKGIYQIISQGDTAGVFQFEGDGITDLIIKAQPSCFADIVAINALFRPGPMDMIPDYLNRKKGKVNVDYLFPELEDILKETYGIIVYQEQVLLIAAKIAGYSYGEADVLRRAMGEKRPAVMKKQKTRFLQGAKKNKYNLKKSEKLFDLVEEFAKYGFNKSHATAYCMLAARTAWLKQYYPVEFFASLLSMEINNTDKIIRYTRDAENHGIKVLPPHINHSEYSFTPSEQHIYFSLGAVKGVGRSVVEHIIQVRETLKNKKFTSIEQFFEEIDIKKINKKCLEPLVKSGAMDGMGLNRNEIILNYNNIIDSIEQKKEETSSGQINFFTDTNNSYNSYIRKKEWSQPVCLANEKEVIGFYLSGHPMDQLKPFMKVCGYDAIVSVLKNNFQKKEGSLSSFWGILSEFREVVTRKGDTMAFAHLEDGTGFLEVVFFSDTYLKFKNLIRSCLDTSAISIKGKLVKKDKYKLLAKEAQLVDNEIKNHARGIILQINEKEHDKLSTLKKILDQHTGSVPLYFNITLQNPPKVVCLKSSTFQGVDLTPQFLETIKETMGSLNKVQIY